jgi:hypothetical protein
MKHLILASALLSCFSIALAQEIGSVQCKPGSDKVPVWIEPHGVHIVALLDCGQEIKILGIANGYVKIRVSDTVYGYISLENFGSPATLKQVPLDQELPSQKLGNPSPRQRTLTITSNAKPEGTARFSLGGSFSWFHIFDYGQLDYLGWDISFVGAPKKYFGIEADISGNYYLSPISLVSDHIYSVAAGPRFMFPKGRVTPYVHFLTGFARERIGVAGIGASANALALMPGGGLEVNLHKYFSLKAFQLDYAAYRSGGAWNYKTLRLSVGVAAKF